VRVDLNGGGDTHPAVSLRQPTSARAASGQGGGGSAAGGASASGQGGGSGGSGGALTGGAVRVEQGERPSSRQEQEASDVFARLLDKQNYVGVARVVHGGQVTPRGGAEGGSGGDATGELHAAGEPHVTGGYACSSVISGHAGNVNFIVAAKGQLFSASQDQTVRVWGLQRDGFREMAELAGHHGFVRALAVSGGGALLFSGSQDKTVRVWDTHTHVQLCALSGHEQEVRALAVHNENLYSGSEDSTIKVWNIASLKCTRTLGGHTAAIFALAVCGDPPVLASGSRDHTVRLWDTQTGECKMVLGSSRAPGHLDCVTCFASAGNQLYSGSRDCSIKHWGLGRAELLKTAHRAHDDMVVSLAASEAARLLVSGGAKMGRIKLWALGSLDYVGVLDGHANGINRLTFHEGAILSASSDRTIRVWTRP